MALLCELDLARVDGTIAHASGLEQQTHRVGDGAAFGAADHAKVSITEPADMTDAAAVQNRAKRSRSGSSNRIATIADVSTTIVTDRIAVLVVKILVGEARAQIRARRRTRPGSRRPAAAFCALVLELLQSRLQRAANSLGDRAALRLATWSASSLTHRRACRAASSQLAYSDCDMPAYTRSAPLGNDASSVQQHPLRRLDALLDAGPGSSPPRGRR